MCRPHLPSLVVLSNLAFLAVACVPVVPGLTPQPTTDTEDEEVSSSTSRVRRSSSTSEESSSSELSSSMVESTSGSSVSGNASSALLASSTSTSGPVGDRIKVVLRWEPGPADLDLHLIHEDTEGAFRSNTAQDCYFDTCLPGSNGPLWDPQSAAHAGGNPTLNGDSASTGPETVVVPRPVAGRYLVGVWAHNDPRAYEITATVETWFDDVLANQSQASLGPAVFWEVGVITWSHEVSPTFEARPAPGGASSSTSN